MPRLVPMLILAAALPLAACGNGTGSSEGTGDEIIVFAAASLTDAFEAIADAFEVAEPGTTVRLNLAGSSSLREQVLAGAPVDVFASADAENLEALVEAGAMSPGRSFATNRLQIVVPAGNPGGVGGLADFADDDLLIGLCSVEVPCGAFARQALAAAGIEAAPDTEEPDVRSLLTKVRSGELDAGIVYATDALAAGVDVDVVELPDAVQVVNEYRIAVSTGTDTPATAKAFVEFMLGSEGRAVLDGLGFGPP